jgi:hypothetical protein
VSAGKLLLSESVARSQDRRQLTAQDATPVH